MKANQRIKTLCLVLYGLLISTTETHSEAVMTKKVVKLLATPGQTLTAKTTITAKGVHKKELKAFYGEQVQPYLSQVGKMRSILYRDYPYLYAPDFDPELEDTSSYQNSNGTIMVASFTNDQLVGFAIGLPLKDYAPKFDPKDKKIKAAQRFKGVQVELATCFYINEICVIPEYRHKGFEKELYKALENEVLKTNKYQTISILHMDRGDKHPLKPKVFVDPEKEIFKTHNFEKTDKQITFSWNTVQLNGSSKKQDNAMNFWVKRIKN